MSPTSYPVEACRDIGNTDAHFFARLEQVANERFDGHFTVMKFTTNWRVCFGLPETSMFDGNVHRLPVGGTFAEAARIALSNPVACSEFPCDALCYTGNSNWKEDLAAWDCSTCRHHHNSCNGFPRESALIGREFPRARPPEAEAFTGQIKNTR